MTTIDLNAARKESRERKSVEDEKERTGKKQKLKNRDDKVKSPCDTTSAEPVQPARARLLDVTGPVEGVRT